MQLGPVAFCRGFEVAQDVLACSQTKLKLQKIYKCPRHPECTVSNFVELTDFWIQSVKYNENEPASNIIATFYCLFVCVCLFLLCFFLSFTSLSFGTAMLNYYRTLTA